MSSLIDQATIKNRRDTASNWTSNDPVLNEGEFGYETDTGKAKIGDGSTAWTSLLYAFIPSGLVTGARYDTGWIANSDWTNMSALLTHNLNANLSDLIFTLSISTDGTDGNSFRLDQISNLYSTAGAADFNYGYEFLQTSLNSVTLQSGKDGIQYLVAGSGVRDELDTEAWYYKVVVTKLTIQS